MKKLNVLVIIFALAMTAACGDKGGKKSSSGLRTYNQFQQGVMTPTTQNGTFNMQTGVVSVGGRSYQPNQHTPQSQQILNQSYQQIAMMVQQNPYAYRQTSAGVYRVRVTGYVIDTQNPQMRYVLNLTSLLRPY